MKKHDALFTALAAVSIMLLGLITLDNAMTTPEQLAAEQGFHDNEQTAAARTAELKKKFMDMGLTLHEGKYWKEQ